MVLPRFLLTYKCFSTESQHLTPQGTALSQNGGVRSKSRVGIEFVDFHVGELADVETALLGPVSH